MHPNTISLLRCVLAMMQWCTVACTSSWRPKISRTHIWRIFPSNLCAQHFNWVGIIVSQWRVKFIVIIQHSNNWLRNWTMKSFYFSLFPSNFQLRVKSQWYNFPTNTNITVKHAIWNIFHDAIVILIDLRYLNFR